MMDIDTILDEIRRDVFDHPKPTIDLDYLYTVKSEIQRYADDTNSQLKKNVYQNYSLFIDSSREITALKEEMRHLNTLLEQQQAAMNKLLDQLNKTPIIQPNLESQDTGTIENDIEYEDPELLPEWFSKSPEELDVLIAQYSLKEAVDLVKRVKDHLSLYPTCCINQPDLKARIDNRVQELINLICSTLQPVTNGSIHVGPRSSISSIQLLSRLNLSSRALKLYLDLRSSILRFVLDQPNHESTTTLQYVKQICQIFFPNIIETCNEFKQVFKKEQHVVLQYYVTLELEYFINLLNNSIFHNNLTLSTIAESMYHVKTLCVKMKDYCDIDFISFMEKDMGRDIERIIGESGRKLIETIRRLDSEERWKPQQFENKAEKTRFIEEMNDVDLDTMPKYISDDFKLHFTASKTAFARCYLIVVSDLAKLITPTNKSHVDAVLVKAFETQMDSVIDALSKAKMTSQARFIKGNSNFLLSKVILVADDRYAKITGSKCQSLTECRNKYTAKADSVAKLVT